MAAQQEWAVAAAGTVIHQGRILLVRHTYGHQEGHWSIPGGYATHDERLDQTIVRELREELGMEAKVVDLVGLVTRVTERGGHVHVVFRMRPLSETFVPDGVELDRFDWFSPEELEALTERSCPPPATSASPR